MVQIQLYDKSTINDLEWPNSEEAQHARALLMPMIHEGVQAYIRNVDTQLYLIKIDTVVIPITVNHREYDNSYLTSNYFPIKYLEERLNQHPGSIHQLQKPILKCIGLILKGIKINKAVIVNNWLLTTNIYPNLSQYQLQELTRFLSARFPDHVLIFRSLNTRKCNDLAKELEKQRYRILYSRNVFIYDPEQKKNFSSKVSYHHRRDRRLIDAQGYEIVHYGKMQPEEVTHLLQLYQSLYHDRHTKYSPQYTEKYLNQASEKQFLHLIGLKKAGEVHGVIGFYERGKTLITPFCGYDQSKAEANHLYRMLTILAIDEAEKRDMVLNDGSGGNAPKQYRGMKSFPEYVALYDRHLPFYRRIFWGIAEKIVKWLALPKINEQSE